jgi:transposase
MIRAHTRDFDDVVAWPAQQMARTPICGLLRIGWDTVGRIVELVSADHLDERRLEELVWIGIQEIPCRRGKRYLTSVADHRRGSGSTTRGGRCSKRPSARRSESSPPSTRSSKPTARSTAPSCWRRTAAAP